LASHLLFEVVLRLSEAARTSAEAEREIAIARKLDAETNLLRAELNGATRDFLVDEM
jgi:hypothetical protein